MSQGEAQFLVSFQQFGAHICGGSIIDPDFIITAAHCCVAAIKNNSTSTLKIAAGTNNLKHPQEGFQLISVAKMIVHPSHDPKTKMADICILRLDESLIISLNRRTAIIALPPAGYVAAGNGKVYGWGQNYRNIRKNTLRRVTVPILADDECRKTHPSSSIADEMICAGGDGKDSCSGDSGGPLVDKENFLVGIVNWGRGACGEPDGYPGVYAEVSYYIRWIRETLVRSMPKVIVGP